MRAESVDVIDARCSLPAGMGGGLTVVNLHPGWPGTVPVRSPILRELLTATPFLSILIETIGYVVALDSMELGIKIMIFKEVSLL